MDDLHGFQVLQCPKEVLPSSESSDDQGKTDHSGDDADLGGGKGIHILHALLAEHQSGCLSHSSPQCKQASKEQRPQTEPFAEGFFFEIHFHRHDQDNAQQGDSHAQEFLTGKHLPQGDPADQGGDGRDQGHDKHGNAGTDQDEGAKQEQIAQHKTHQAGYDQPEPLVWGGLGQWTPMDDGTVNGQEHQAHDQPDQVQGEGAHALPGRFKGHGGDGPAGRGEQGGYFTQVLWHGYGN